MKIKTVLLILLPFALSAAGKELYELGEPEIVMPLKKSPAPNFRQTQQRKAAPQALIAAPKPIAIHQAIAPTAAPIILEQAPTTAPQKVCLTASREIKISNDITKDMKTYKKHWSGHHLPSSFSLSVNGQQLPEAPSAKRKAPQEKPQPLALSLAGNQAEIEYSFDFTAMGVSYRKGSKKCTVEVPADTTDLQVLFSWDEPNRIIIKNALTGARLPVTPAS